jgi:hypothetical protein
VQFGEVHHPNALIAAQEDALSNAAHGWRFGPSRFPAKAQGIGYGGVGCGGALATAIQFSAR